ncbi:glycosyltransferase family 61 protein [Opitutaceae bacterium]
MRFGGKVETHAPAHTITYALPPHAPDEVRAFWASEPQVALTPEITAHIPGGRVFGAGAILAPDGTSLARDVSMDFGKPPDEHWLLSYPKIRPPQPIAGTLTVVASALASGYSHWLLDELPRLLTLPPDAAGTLLAHTSEPYARVALALQGWRGALLQPGRTTHHQSEHLVVPSLLGSVVQPSPRALELITAFTARLPTPAAPIAGERLYLSRERAQRRRVLNEHELWSLLETNGFTKLHLEDLTWSEQIDAFRRAKVIVAPHGAGLANLAFCPPGTRVIELFHRSYVHGCFWRLAALRALDYRPVITPGSEPLGQAPRHNRLDFAASLTQVRAALRE